MHAKKSQKRNIKENRSLTNASEGIPERKQPTANTSHLIYQGKGILLVGSLFGDVEVHNYA